MNYLTNYYKNLCEQLQDKLNILQEVYRLTPLRRQVLDAYLNAAQENLEKIHKDADLPPPVTPGNFGQIPGPDQHSQTLVDPRYVTPSGQKTGQGFDVASKMTPNELIRDRVQLLRLRALPQDKRFASAGGSPWLYKQNEWPGQERMDPTLVGFVSKSRINNYPGIGQTTEEPHEVLERIHRERDERHKAHMAELQRTGFADQFVEDPNHSKFKQWFYQDYIPNIQKPQDEAAAELRAQRIPPEALGAKPDGLGIQQQTDIGSDEHLNDALNANRRMSKFYGKIGNRDVLKHIEDVTGQDFRKQFPRSQ